METKITTVSLATKEDKYYADKTLYQWNYGQILRIIDADLPMAVEIGFSTTEKSGDSDVRVGSTNNGVTTVAIPNKLFEEERSTDYSIYAFVYVTDENSGTTVHEIVIPVKARAKQGDPSEDPSIDPSIFKDAVNAVNASAERAETAEKSAKESADKAKEYAESARKSKEDVEKARNNAISAIGIEKESALRGIESKTVESLQKIHSQTEESQNGIKQSIADATEKKTELDGAISNATDAKGNLDKAVQSAGNAKTELDTSVGKAGEAKTALDSSINSAGEKKLALDTTVEQANTVDASLKEHIGSAEQIQANVEQIAKNKADISSLNEDIVDLSDKKITKFYASNQGETHLADSDKGLVQDIKIYGQGEQSSTTGAQLFNENIEIKNRGVIIKINGSTATFEGTVSDEVNLRVNYQKNIKLKPGKYTASSSNKKIVADFTVKKANDEMIYNNHIEIDGTEKEVKIRVLFGLKPSAKGDVINETTNIMLNDGDIALPYEPYTGGQPSPSPDYPQEIKRVVNPTVKVTNEDGLKVQSATLNNIILNAIPVVSGGNYTDQSGQQWICDEVDLVRGVKVQRVKVRELSPDDKWAYRKLASGNNNFQTSLFNADVAIDGKPCFCNILPFKNVIWDDSIQNLPKIYANDQEITVSFPPSSEYSSLEAFKHMLTDVKSVIYYILATPIETPLTQEEASAFKQLMTYYPVTNISVTSDQLDGYTVFNYPISMANGWNYVKQQLNDNRDYIYDMDIQSAEAYVNSEYAVALTELEV